MAREAKKTSPSPSSDKASPASAAAVRKRKHHRKSRLGCGNCKLRRIKCDETQPRCNNCARFLVACSYDSSVSGHDLEPTSTEGALTFQLTIVPPKLANDALLTVANKSLAAHYPDEFEYYNVFQLDMQDLDRLKRWHTRTVFCIGTSASAFLFQREVIRLVDTHPYLMHAVLAMTAMHDRFLRSPGVHDATSIECYHQSRSAALFNSKLSSPIQSEDRNAIFTTAVLLGNMSLYNIQASDPEASWPLIPAAPSQFDWLHLQIGLSAVWNLTLPAAPGGIYEELAKSPKHYYLRYKMEMAVQPGIEGIPQGFVELCNLSPSSTAENNPYLPAVRSLSMVLNIECTPSSTMRFMAFTSLIRPEFRDLLKERDPRALIILAHWYVKVWQSNWFIRLRALVEYKAICLFIERYHYHDAPVMKELHILKARGAVLMQEGEALALRTFRGKPSLALTSSLD